MELVLEPLCEVELDNVADVHWSARPSASVEEQSFALRVVVEDEIKVAVREEDASANEIGRVTENLFQFLGQRTGYRLGSKITDEPVIVHLPFYFPRCHNELFFNQSYSTPVGGISSSKAATGRLRPQARITLGCNSPTTPSRF